MDIVDEKKYRFSLFIDDGNPIVYIGGNPIMEGIFKKGKTWEIGYKLKIGSLFFVAFFDEWKGGKSFDIDSPNGEVFRFTKEDVRAIKKLIHERDKRIKI